MSFGFGFSLPSWQALSGGFSPAALFAGGTVAGAWYDPSDLSTLFDSSTGTTPVSMPGQGAPVPVGLMLDKSQGLVLGSELVTNGDFSGGTTTGWSVLEEGGVVPTLSIVNGALQSTYTFGVGRVGAYQAFTTVIGKWYKVSSIARHISGTNRDASVRIGTGSGNQYGNYTIVANFGSITGSSFTQMGGYFLATSTTTTILLVSGGSGSGPGTFTDQFDDITVEEIAGNHAISFNNFSARPVLMARVNLLTYSEEFDNGAWTLSANISAFGSGSVVNATTAPNNTTTADLLTENLNTGDRSILQLVTSSSAVIQSIYVKPNGRTWAYLQMTYTGGTIPVVADRRVWFNCVGAGSVGTVGAQYSSPSITALPDGWYRISAIINPASTGSTGTNFVFGFTTADGTVSYTGDGTSGMYWWGADLRPANIGANVPAYQRIADALTYDTNGFPLYLYFDGTDDSMYTPANLNLSGTDKVAVFAGVRKLSDATGGQVLETSSDLNANNGTFLMAFPGNIGVIGPNMVLGLRGTASAFSDARTYTAPITGVLQASFDIAQATVADEIKQRINGAVPTSISYLNANAGTGNFGTYPLYIGSRGNSAFRLNGHLYSLIIAGSAVSAGNISATEQWVAQRTGIAI